VAVAVGSHRGRQHVGGRSGTDFLRPLHRMRCHACLRQRV